uniref:Uncharacterized protein n=1 Tax=Ditylenchus dipsaci TaxID=166011 RepID=A0A915DYX1_9BILA
MQIYNKRATSQNINKQHRSPSLHIIQGLCQNVINWIEKAEPSLLSKLEEVYRSLGAEKQAWYQSFTGNHCRKLLTGDGPDRIASVIQCHPKRLPFVRAPLFARRNAVDVKSKLPR